MDTKKGREQRTRDETAVPCLILNIHTHWLAKADELARMTKITRSSVRGGMITMVEWAYRHHSTQTRPDLICAHFDVDASHVGGLIESLIACDLLARQPDNALVILDGEYDHTTRRLAHAQAGATQRRANTRKVDGEAAVVRRPSSES